MAGKRSLPEIYHRKPHNSTQIRGSSFPTHPSGSIIIIIIQHPFQFPPHQTVCVHSAHSSITLDLEY